jgi:hypothetical protein
MSDVIGEAIFPFTIGELPALWAMSYNGLTFGGVAPGSTYQFQSYPEGLDIPDYVTGDVQRAIEQSVKNAVKTTFVYPAAHTDGKSENANAPQMGQRIYIAYTKAEIEALTVKPWLKTVFQALREYGAYVTDTGNFTMAFQMEGSEMFTSFGQPEPFSAIAIAESLPTISGFYAFKFEEGVDWTKLRAIEHP